MIKNVKLLDDDALKEISGADLTENAEDSVDYFVFLYKRAGSTLDELRAELIEQYHDNPRLYSTDGSEEDLQELIKMYESSWEGNTYHKPDHSILLRKKEL